MFWGLVVQPNKKYSKTVSTPFHVSQACLDISSLPSSDNDVQLVLKSDKVDYILCILSKKSGVCQVPLNLIFSEGDEISFRSIGGTVHLTGYLVDDQYRTVEDASSDDEVTQLKMVEKERSRNESSSDNESQVEDTDDEDVERSEDDDSESCDVEPRPKKSRVSNGSLNGAKKSDKKHEKNIKQKSKLPTTGEKMLQGGVKIEDIRLGRGPEAKFGKKVQVYYEGRFKTNNKVFDKTNTGDGLKFQLGRGEVIKGWDVGVLGMRVGSKRRITCPPNMAYGSKGSPPVIPPNSTLVFDVELRGLY